MQCTLSILLLLKSSDFDDLLVHTGIQNSVRLQLYQITTAIIIIVVVHFVLSSLHYALPIWLLFMEYEILNKLCSNKNDNYLCMSRVCFLC